MATVTFDPENDVLYVAYSDQPATKGIEGPAGVIRRYDGDDLIGVTVLDFTHRLMGGELMTR